MKRLVVLAQDPDGPVVRHRVRALARWLPGAGFASPEIVEIPRRVHRRLGLFRSLRSADLVLLVRKLFTSAEFRVLRRYVKRLAYEFDDAVLFRDPWRRQQESRTRRRRFHRTVRAADLVIAGNAYLAGLAAKASPAGPVEVIPTSIDVDHYVPGSPPRGFVIGWIGSQSTRPYLQDIVPAVEQVAKRRPDLVFSVMADRPPSVPNLSFEPWSEIGEVPFLHGLTAGVMPIRDDPFSLGKCGFKLLEYMACGLPWVASPVGVNVDMADRGRAGILARTTEEWVAALERLADADQAGTIGARGRELVEERWSTDVWGPRWAEALATASGRAPAA